MIPCQAATFPIAWLSRGTFAPLLSNLCVPQPSRRFYPTPQTPSLDGSSHHEDPGKDQLGDVGGFSYWLGAGEHRRLLHRQSKRNGRQPSERAHYDGRSGCDPDLYFGKRQPAPATTDESGISSIRDTVIRGSDQFSAGPTQITGILLPRADVEPDQSERQGGRLGSWDHQRVSRLPRQARAGDDPRDASRTVPDTRTSPKGRQRALPRLP